MENQEFKAFVVEEIDGEFKRSIKTKQIKDLPEGDLIVKVEYSSLNYKDALSATGNKGVTRQFPHTPGIDAVGIVAQSDNSEFQVGEQVIVTSYDLGMNTDGGFAEYIRVPSAWAVKLPENMTAQEAMIYGTAGFTAGMSVLRLAQLVTPEAGNILVSGATGGVGSLSVAILAKLGYNVIAITGKETEQEYLKNLGAKEVILRKEFEELPAKPLLKPMCAGAIDTVGGTILQNILKVAAPMAAVTCCGNAASIKLETTVFPFILRGVSLIGIDSQNYPMEYRKIVWQKLATEYKSDKLVENYQEVGLEELDEKINHILKGQVKGRILVKL